MSDRIPILCLAGLLFFLPIVAAHGGEADAAPVCPDLAILYGHVHDDEVEGRYFWLDTDSESEHAEASAYWAPPAASDNRTFVLAIEPNVTAPTALSNQSTIQIVLSGRAESSTGPLLPGPVQGVLDTLLGNENVPGAVKQIIRDNRHAQFHNVGSSDVTLRATLRAGDTVVGQAEATGVNPTPDDTLAELPSPSDHNEAAPDPPRESPADAPPVHPPGQERAPFRASFEFPPVVSMLPAGLPVTLTVERLEPFAWDLRLEGDDGLRVDLPVVDHRFGPVCPDWDLPDVTVTSTAPAEADRAPGGVLDFRVVVNNSARLPTEVAFSFAQGGHGVVAGSIQGIGAKGNASLGPYEERHFHGRYTVAEYAPERPFDVVLVVEHDNGTVRHTTTVHVVEPPEEAGPSKGPGPDQEDDATTFEASDAPQSGPGHVADLDPAEDGGSAPAAGVVAALLAALLAAIRQNH